MRTTIMNSRFRLLLTAGLLALFAFDRPGAHSVQIYLDNEMVIERYVDSRTAAPRLQLDPNGKHRELSIRYSECGRTVDGRRLTLSDQGGKELKTWSFPGATAGFKDPMICKVSDILACARAENRELRLAYASDDFPESIQILALEVKSLSAVSGQ